MPQYIGCFALIVRDYDEAIAYYTSRLGFQLIEDAQLGGGKRWILLAPPGSKETRLLLAKAASAEQLAHVGDQTGGRVFLFLHTDDFWRDYYALRSREVLFLETPREEPYGTVAVFEDLYGNKWDLIWQKPKARSAASLTENGREGERALPISLPKLVPTAPE